MINMKLDSFGLFRHNEVALMINNESFFISIKISGLERCLTSFPQKGVDYDTSYVYPRPKIVGVDEI